ncbi:MAG: Rrf2 family transcriptional regulator [Acidobacteria bacterium]|nr:Rrf2 family transcriptional regulator [Acidobacteriota bacterium]
MQLTRAADYAVRVMVHLAGLPAGVRATRDEMAVSGDVPEAFLSKILQSLTRAGLIASHRGVSGGYLLGRPAASITVLDIVEAMEGPLQLNACVGSKPTCGRAGICSVHDIWLRAQEALTSVLQSENIADLAGKAAQRRSAGGGVEWS